MFTKRVKAIRDLQQEVSILEKKIERETSKFQSDVEREIEKRFKQIHPGCRIDLDDIYKSDFKTNKRHREPMKVFINSLNGRFLDEKLNWNEFLDEKGYERVVVENHVTGPEMVQICRELSEKLGILVEIIKY